MKHVLCLVGVCGLFVACGAPAYGATRPSTAPSTRPVAAETLADGAVSFNRPADWEEAQKNRTPLRAAWVSPDRKGMILVEVWPEGQIAASTGPQTVRRLREDRKKQQGVKVIMEAAIEKDQRFAMRIHEKYQYTADGTVDDVLRLGRQVGGRVVVVTVWSKSPDDARDKEIHQAAEEVSLSVTVGKPAAKPPKKR
jgi:hypothetical protein